MASWSLHIIYPGGDSALVVASSFRGEQNLPMSCAKDCLVSTGKSNEWKLETFIPGLGKLSVTLEPEKPRS